MIFIFDDQGNRLPITWQGLDFNAPFDTRQTFDGAEQEGIFTDVVAWNTPVNFQSEVAPDLYKGGGGIEYYNPRTASRVLNIRARVQCKSLFKLGAYLQRVQRMFSPLYLQQQVPWPSAGGRPAWANPWSTYFMPLTGYHLDDDTFKAGTPAGGILDAAHYPSGKLPLEYAVVPLELPDPVISAIGSGWGGALDMSWIVLDGGIGYGQVVWQRQGNGTLIPDWADVVMFPHITVEFDGAGASNLTIGISSDHPTLPDYSLVLNASGMANNKIVDIYTADRVIYVNGVVDNTLYSSGDWPILAPAGYTNTITWSNTTNVTTSSNVVEMREVLSA